jgi:Fic family protein
MNFPLTQGILRSVSRLDRFRGTWSAIRTVPADRLARMREAAQVQSIAASCRLSGIRVSDAEVAGLLQDQSVRLSDARQILGYAAGLDFGFPHGEALLDSRAIRTLHAVVASGGEATEPSPWRTQPYYREAFDAEGRAKGRVFTTLPPRLIESKVDELITWLELEMRGRETHPVLVVGAFALGFLSACPFEHCNGRLSRLLVFHLLQRCGYGYMPYASLESQMEDLREDYHDAFQRGQMRLWAGEADLEPWLVFFLEVLSRHQKRVEAKLTLEKGVLDYPPLQQAILETVREHGTVGAGLLLEATGANRNTLKDNLRRMVQRGVLEKTGQRRGTRYRLAIADPAKTATPAGG